MPIGETFCTIVTAEYSFNTHLRTRSPQAPYINFFRGTSADSLVRGVVVMRHMTRNQIMVVRTFKGTATGKRCKGCKVFYFADAETQKAAWPLHKKVCKALGPCVAIRVNSQDL